MNTKVLFNDGWEFAKSGLDVTNNNELNFERVELPHDWLIYNSLDLYEDSIGWYRKKLVFTAEDKQKNQQLLLAFDGVYMDSTLYVNNKVVGEWKYGYSFFEHEITDALIEGENEILVKVMHQHPNSRWYSGAGIYRDVWLKTREDNHVVTDGIYITTKQLAEGWKVEIDTELHISTDVQISHTIKYDNKEIQVVTDKVITSNTDTIVNHQSLILEQPLLWSPDQPNLYEVITKLHVIKSTDDDQEVEEVTQNIGFRSIVFDPNLGFQLNGHKMKLNGVCEHHDLGALGAAFNITGLRRRFTLLKEMGVNAVRTAHNMPAKALMNLADEMGLFVVSEGFDMWERSKTPYDYARFFKDWAHRDVKSWVMRDRNHPSLIMWSIGNEIYDTHADERGQEVTRLLMEYVQEFDPKENAKSTIGSNYMPWENAQKCADIVKLAGYNYAEKYYDKHHEEHPDWMIYGSETASVVQSRGIYHFPFEQSILAEDDEQCSALGNSTTSWGAKSAEACIIAERDTPFSMGQFIWTGFDYIGEPTPYHTKNSYFGQIDTATFPKDSYYIYQAGWTDYRINPMVHIFPYWDFNPGQLIDVRVCSNAPKIELQLNGKTIGTYDIDHQHGTQLVGWWKVPYQEGVLTAIAYNEAGEIIATDVKRSFGDATQIGLKPDKEEVLANGTDLIFLEINMKDEYGNVVENANNRVHVQVSGAGRLIGLDNGDSTDYDQYKGVSKRLFSGKLMAIIGSTHEDGEIRVEVSSTGMKTEKIELKSITDKGTNTLNTTYTSVNHAESIVHGSDDEIPLRKIEIVSEDGQLFTDSLRELNVKVKLYPHNTSYDEVEWSVVNDAGIESNIAKVEVNGHEAKLIALSDGKFRIRCMSKNGTDKTKLISQLEYEITGLGTAYKDPYGFITGGLYDVAKGDVSNGNERGVATSRDGETQVCFRNIDFGPYGADTITIPIFALSSEVYKLQIWEGMPEEQGSEMLADVIYEKESQWNVYQPETYQLSKRLKGLTSICFVLNQKIHIKGFSFEKENRAFARNLAIDSDQIYGDTFTITENSVEGIGNNVSLGYDNMDFTAEGASKLIIYGHSPIDKNTIHIRMSGESEENNQLVEFVQSEGYEEQVFNLDLINGLQKVTFIFLPGSNFDFGWFRFMKN